MVTRPGRKPAATVVAAAFALIMYMTLRPVAANVSLPASCIICGPLGGVDFALNIVLFIPLGGGLRWLLGRWNTAIFIGTVTTLVIESLQWRLIPGRDASLGDLLANTLGTILGAWLAIEGVRWLNATHFAARRLAGAFGIAVTLVAIASAWLLQPVHTRYPQWVQWTPARKYLDTFQGRLMDVELNGIPIRPTEILQPHRSLDATSRSVTVRATLTDPAAPTRRPAIIVRIANPLEEGFSLGQSGHAATFRTHVAAERLRLRSIIVGLENALSASDAKTNGTAAEVIVEGNSNPRAIGIRVEPPGRATGVTLRRTIGLAWALFLPRDVALGPGWWLANATWLAILVLPVAFFTRRSGHREGDGAGITVAWWPLPLFLVSLAAVPAATGLSPLGVGEWAGVLVGVGAGVALERWTAASPADLKACALVRTILS